MTGAGRATRDTRAARDPRPAVGRLASRVAIAVLGALAVLLLAPASAQALPGIPDCKDPPAPTAAGSGISGLVDPGPVPPPPPADPFAANSATSLYAQYGYGGLRWSTYDLGCLGSVGDPGATIDTLVGNWGLGLSVFMVSLSNGLHAAVVDPSWLVPLDNVIATVTATIHDAIWAPWGAVGLLGVVVLLLVYSVRGQLSEVVRGAAWALLVLTVLAGVVNYPQRAGQYYDTAVIGTLHDLEASALGVGKTSGSAAGAAGSSGSGGPSAAGARSTVEAHGALLVDKVLYQAWLRGEIGSATGADATRWGAALFQGQALSYREVATTGGDASRRNALDQQKSDAWKATAQQVQDADPSAYATIQGRQGGRAAAGALALFAAATTSLFRIVADLFLAAGLVMLRLLVMFFPAVAVLGVMVAFSGLVRRLANAAGAAVINVVAFGAASVLHTVVITAALGAATGGLSWMALVLCLLVTVLMFVLCLPLLSLTSLAGTHARGSGWAGSALRGSVRLAGSYVATRRATRPRAPGGAEDSDDDADQQPTFVFVNLAQARYDEQTPADQHVPDDEPAPRVWVSATRRARPDREPRRPLAAPPARAALRAGTAVPESGRAQLPPGPFSAQGFSTADRGQLEGRTEFEDADDALEGMILEGMTLDGVALAGRGSEGRDGENRTGEGRTGDRGVLEGTILGDRALRPSAGGLGDWTWHDANVEPRVGRERELLLWDPRLQRDRPDGPRAPGAADRWTSAADRWTGQQSSADLASGARAEDGVDP